MFRSSQIRVLLLVAVPVSFGPSCGAKTGLTVEACVDAGTRPCDHPCGEASQACLDGAWTVCTPRVTERACESECGAGTQTCTAEGWGSCEAPELTRDCTTPCGDGVETCRRGRWGPCSFPEPAPPVLEVVVRDFRDLHPDFESDRQGNDRGIVEEALGADDLPVYAGESRTTSGREAFDQWYRDVPGVNRATRIELPLVPEEGGVPNRWVYDDPSFFPIDGELFGNEGRPHNFHFTLAATTAFVYEGGETFTFRGDDDVFVFIDRRLVIDLGGVHRRQVREVALDELGLEAGERYPLHLFFAERHTSESSFRIETTLSDPVIRCD